MGLASHAEMPMQRKRMWVGKLAHLEVAQPVVAKHERLDIGDVLCGRWHIHPLGWCCTAWHRR